MRKSTRVLGWAATGIMAAGIPLGLAASSASAATHHPLTATTKIVNRLDNGGNGPWAHDTMTRTATVNFLGKVTQAMVDANPALAPYLGTFMYNGSIQDKGTFKDIPGAFAPNQSGHNLGKHLRPTQVSGPMTGSGYWGVFYASQKAHNGLVPQQLRGAHLNSLYPSSVWPELFFPAGTTFQGVNEGAYDYNYQAVPHTKYVVKTVNGKRVIVKVIKFAQHWEDSSWNNDGQLPRDGQILGLR
jgi:hypothetical protein